MHPFIGFIAMQLLDRHREFRGKRGLFAKDREFFEFYRSLTAYEESLKGNNSTMVMSPDSEFFNYLRSDQGSRSDEGERN